MKNLLNFLQPYRKSVVAFATPGALLLLGALLPGSPGGSAITSGEWTSALAASLATAGIVWKTKNKVAKRY